MALDIVFMKSAVLPADFPKADLPEIALAGRSNAGKSSFLNSIAKKPIAKVSQEPGKTRLLNFFNVGKSYRIVDMPGYGFAKRSGDEVVSWGKMIGDYLDQRETLTGLVLLMDIKRDWSEDEEILADYMFRRNLPLCLILTKSDHLKKNEIEKRIHILQTQSGVNEVFAVSNVKKIGTKEVEDYIFREWIKPQQKRPHP